MLTQEEMMAINGYSDDYLSHHGILGMKWGIRRYQNKDGSLTSAGKARYDSDILSKAKTLRTGPSRAIKSLNEKRKFNSRLKKENKQRAEFAEKVAKRNKQSKNFAARMALRSASAVAKLGLTVGAGVAAAKLSASSGAAALAGGLALGAATSFLKASLTKTVSKTSTELANKIIKDQYDVPLSRVPKQLTAEEFRKLEERRQKEGNKK